MNLRFRHLFIDEYLQAPASIDVATAPCAAFYCLELRLGSESSKESTIIVVVLVFHSFHLYVCLDVINAGRLTPCSGNRLKRLHPSPVDMIRL